MNPEIRIQARGVTRRFGSKTALHPTDLDVGAGAVVGLLGPNGSGKSTLLRILVGLVRPDAGSASLAGVPLRGDGTAARRRTTFAPGELSLYDELRARDHLRWLLRGREPAAFGRALAIAEGLDLPLAARVRTYSHGMKRQLLFAAALAPDVPVRILDEPSEGLDPSKRSEMLDVLEEDARRGTTILLSSHHLGEVDRSCEQLLFLSEGRLIRSESAAAVRERASRVVRLTYASDDVARRAATALADVPGVTARPSDERVLVELEDANPLPFLGVLATRNSVAGLPTPLGLEYGRLSLQDLYSDLYGVEAC